MSLITYKDYNITIAPEALTIKPLGALWKRDRTISKDRALKELSYIYFMYDPRSDYRINIPDEIERQAEILRDEAIPPAWLNDKDMKKAIEYYTSMPSIQSAELKGLDTAIRVLNRVNEYCDTLDFAEQEDPIKAMKDVTGMIKSLPDLITGIKAAKKALFASMEESGRARGGGAPSIGDDGFDAFLGD